MRFLVNLQLVTCLGLLGVSAFSAGANALTPPPVTNTPYIDPSIVNQVQQQGGKVIIDHNSITIDMGQTLSVGLNGNLPPTLPPGSGCGACVTISSSSPQLHFDGTIPANTASISPSLDSAIIQQAQVTGALTDQAHLTATSAANLSPSAGGAYDPITAANGFLRNDGLGGN